MDFDTKVKLQIYKTIAATTGPPSPAIIAAALQASVPEVEAAYQRLYQKRLLVLAPDSTQILMAPPFSGVETQHITIIHDKKYFANCAWDAFGIAAALHSDADIESTCGDCGEPLSLQIRNAKPVSQECIVHFAVPAAQWWNNIVYT